MFEIHQQLHIKFFFAQSQIATKSAHFAAKYAPWMHTLAKSEIKRALQQTVKAELSHGSVDLQKDYESLCLIWDMQATRSNVILCKKNKLPQLHF